MLSRQQVFWVEVLAEYAINFMYKPGWVHSVLDALFRISALKIGQMLQTIGKCYKVGGWVVSTQHDELCNQEQLEAAHQSYQNNTNQEFIHFWNLVGHSKSDFLLVSGLFANKIDGLLPLVTPGDALLFQQKILEELHTSPLGGRVGYYKLLELVCTQFWWPRLSKSVQEF